MGIAQVQKVSGNHVIFCYVSLLIWFGSQTILPFSLFSVLIHVEQKVRGCAFEFCLECSFLPAPIAHSVGGTVWSKFSLSTQIIIFYCIVVWFRVVFSNKNCLEYYESSDFIWFFTYIRCLFLIKSVYTKNERLSQTFFLTYLHLAAFTVL